MTRANIALGIRVKSARLQQAAKVENSLQTQEVQQADGTILEANKQGERTAGGTALTTAG